MTWVERIKKMCYFKSNHEWYYYESDDDDAIPLLTEKAPPEAVESYKLWKEWYDEQTRTGEIIM